MGATYKGLWTKVKQNAAHRKSGRTRKRYKGLDRPPKYVSPTLTYQYERGYSFKKDRQVRLSTLERHVIVPYIGYNQHIALIKAGTQIGAARLWYNKPKKQLYLLVALTIETADPTPETHTGVAGVDVGVRYLAVTATRIRIVQVRACSLPAGTVIIHSMLISSVPGISRCERSLSGKTG